MVAINITKRLYDKIKPHTNNRKAHDPKKVSFSDILEAAWIAYEHKNNMDDSRWSITED